MKEQCCQPKAIMLQRTLLVVGLLVSCAACTPAPDALPTVLYTNATFWTGDADQPYIDGLLVQGDRIVGVVAVGANPQASEVSDVVDLGGAFVVPGFIDNHTHFLTGGFQLASVDLRSADSPEEFARRIADFAAAQPPGTWITGGDWDHEAWGGELPHRDWIDDATSDYPVFVSRLDGHMALANTRALQLAGLTIDTSAPDGGEIVRDADGEPTGVLKDEAMNPVAAVVPVPSDAAFDEALERGIDHALSLGVTQIHDVGSYGGWDDLAVFQRAHAEGRLRLRVYSMVPLRTWARMADYIDENGRGDDHLRWGALKGFVDGSLGSTTAWFYDPYTDEPGTAGLLVNDTTALHQWIMDADAAGLHLAVHAIGDRANDWLLDAFAEAAAQNGDRDRRFRIEHAQHLTRDAIARFAMLGVVPSMQPFHGIDDGRWAEKRIGSDRIQTTYAFRSLLDANARLTFGSDWTVAPISPLEGIYAAVTRQTIDGANPDGWVPNEKISVEDALRAYTAHNAWAGFQDDRLGALKPNYLADFVVLDTNLLTIPPEQLREVQVLRTVVGGETVFVR